MMIRVMIILVLQTVFLGGMIARKQNTLNYGKPVLLETQPIDPRSLFRGDYVVLNYTISTLNLHELEGDDDFRGNDAIYVQLRKAGDYHQAVAVYHQHPGVDSEAVVIRGKITYINNQRWDQESNQYVPQIEARVRYGIENYFVPEGEGRQLEGRLAGQVDIRVAVDDTGNSGIKAVLVNGEEQYVEKLF